MPRYSLTQLLMGVALLAILLTFTRTEGCGRRYALVECISFSSDGSHIAVSKLTARDAQVSGKGYMANLSRTLSLLDASNGEVAGIIHQDFMPGNQGPAWGFWQIGRTSAVINPTNNSVVAHDFGGGHITHYDPDGHSDPMVSPLKHRAFNIAISESGRLVACAGEYGLTIIETETNTSVLHIQLDDFDVWRAPQIAFSADEQRIFVADISEVYFWNIATGAQSPAFIEGVDPWINAIALAPEATLIVCSGEGAYRYDSDGHIVQTLVESERCSACCVSDDGQTVALIVGGEAMVFDLDSGAQTSALRWPRASAIAFSPDGESLVVGDRDGGVVSIDVRTAQQQWTSNPPGRHRSPWTLPVSYLAVWAYIAWRLAKRSNAENAGSPGSPIGVSG